jgi:serine/threonine protein kinase
MASLEDYRLGQVIAQGSFGTDIRHGQYYKKDKDEPSSAKKSPKSYLHVSIKCVSKRSLSSIQPAQRARSYGLAVVQEQQLLRRFGGNLCVPKLYACFHNVDHVVTVTECCTGGSLQDVIFTLSHDASFSPASWREHCAVQLFDILVFLHTSSIVHGDLSPSVLHLTGDGNLRLVDFGYAVDLRNHTNNNAMTIRPQTCFSAPELWQDGDGTVAVSTAVDLWSAGCICFALHATHSPFAVATTNTTTTTTISKLASTRSTTATTSPEVTSMPHKKRKVEEVGNNNQEAAQPAATGMQAQVDAAVGQRIAAFTKEYHDNNNAATTATTKEESTSKKKLPQLLRDLPFFNDDEMWRDIVYELLHPDPLSRTQAATTRDNNKTTTTDSGDMYDAIRNRFLQSMATAAAGTTTTTAFQPPAPRWLREDEASSNSSSSSGDTSSGDDTN